MTASLVDQMDYDDAWVAVGAGLPGRSSDFYGAGVRCHFQVPP